MISKRWLEILCCPICKGDLSYGVTKLTCRQCGEEYAVIDDIPVLVSLDEQERKKYQYQIDFSKRVWSKHQQSTLAEWKKVYVKRIFGVMGIVKGKRKAGIFLDVGAGASGYMVIEYARRGGLGVGCDLSLQVMIKAKAYARGVGVENKTFWVVCNAEELPFKDGVFSYLCAIAVLEHLPHDEEALEEIDRITKKKSEVFFTTPIKYRYNWPFFIPLNYAYDKYIGHARRYDKAEYERKLKFTKFRIVKAYYTGHFWKMFLFLVSKVLGTRAFDRLIERIDVGAVGRSYGASNISVHLKTK